MSTDDQHTTTQQRRIADLERELHDANNRLTTAEGALELLAVELSLTRDATPAQILAAALGRLR